MKRTKWVAVTVTAAFVAGSILWLGERNVRGAAQAPTPTPAPAPLILDPYPGQATVQVASGTSSPTNFAGRFEKIATEPYQTVTVAVTWPQDDPNAGVLVYAIHGGWIDGAGQRYFSFETSKTIQFDFKNSGSPGTYQVILRRGTTEEVLQFYIPRDSASVPVETAR
jgi:hypothetical protein